MEKGLYPYSKYYLEAVKRMRGSYWGNHFSTIGLVGMNEALLNFIGKDIGSPQGRKFALEILDFMREKLIEYQEETGNLYNLEARRPKEPLIVWLKKTKKIIRTLSTAGRKKLLITPIQPNCRLIIPMMFLRLWNCRMKFRPNIPAEQFCICLLASGFPMLRL